jgi:hypothetical protein
LQIGHSIVNSLLFECIHKTCRECIKHSNKQRQSYRLHLALASILNMTISPVKSSRFPLKMQ